MVPIEHLFKHQLGFAVGIDGALGQILGHRHAIGRPVRGAGGTENKLFHLRLHGGIQQRQTVAGVIVKIFPRIGHGFTDQCARGEMQDGFRRGGFDGVADVVIFSSGRAENERSRADQLPSDALQSDCVDRDLDGPR